MTGTILEAEHPAGRLYAAIDANARFCGAAVASSRFGAMLSPFTTEAAAREALAAAGAQIAGAPAPKRRVVGGVK